MPGVVKFQLVGKTACANAKTGNMHKKSTIFFIFIITKKLRKINILNTKTQKLDERYIKFILTMLCLKDWS